MVAGFRVGYGLCGVTKFIFGLWTGALFGCNWKLSVFLKIVWISWFLNSIFEQNIEFAIKNANKNIKVLFILTY